ncbi:MAG: CHAT domain-containing protein [Anaerolineales bacterium]|nr:MAG: CHAT domain-containing protein [Anaerolineales bacterium]
MNEYADLEISLHRHDASSYAVEFRFSLPDSDADIRLGVGKPALAQFDLEALNAQVHDPAGYGQALSQSLFADPAILTVFGQARASAQSQDVPIRLRLLVGPSAPELHRLHWETLRDPQDNSPLFTGENLLFSRYLSSLDWRPVKLRPKADLHALIAVANPSNLAEYDLAPVDVAGEVARSQASLGSISATVLPEAGTDQHTTLSELTARLREGVDILYLVCHGAFVRDESWLWLEDAEGKVARTSGTDLVTRLRELDKRPRLIVLASCQSAGTSAGDALAALGPRLAEAGIPAVIAMQGNITMDTVADFMPTFFEELQHDGQIDRALSVARGEVRERSDYWMPALFMRLRSGRIWYVPGFGDERAGFQKWPSLLRSIRRGQCTPILGPGLLEPVIGSLKDVAQRWAETYHYPMAPHERESLPQVSQYLAINQDRGFPYDELGEYLREELKRRYKEDIPEKLLSNYASLDELLETIGAKRREREPNEAYKALAQLPLPIFITTTPDNLLTAALKEAGKDPQVVLCPWNDYVEQAESIYDQEPDYFPTPERPLIYYLFGELNEPDSVVLTEDDYFDFLIGVTGNKDLIPPGVRRALTDTALLFLGFQMDEWNFRILFRSILSLQGGGRRDRYAHIAAQIEPEEGRLLEPARARRYLENYFSKGADISIYWGSSDDFLKELVEQIAERAR